MSATASAARRWKVTGCGIDCAIIASGRGNSQRRPPIVHNLMMPRVQLFATCLVDSIAPQVGFAVATVLDRLGCEVHVPEGQTCCGQPAFNAGFHDAAREMARYTVTLLSQDDAPVVVPSGSCADMLVHQAPRLLADDPAAPQAQAVAARTYELTQFLADVLRRTDCGACAAGSATYHPSCHGLRGLGVRRQPQALLERVNGLDLRPLPDAETCCGFGGLFAVKMSEISAAMLERKLENIEATGAEAVVATDVSCLMHIAGGLHRRGSAVKAVHIAEVLAKQRP
jgi:L-lactate dehydrogenase complex protein LldE